MVDLRRRLVAEAIGTGLLVATVVGSGVMAEGLTRDGALALLANTLPTGAILVVLITVFAPLSGGHFNPAVSLVMALRRALPPGEAGLYVLVQLVGLCSVQYSLISCSAFPCSKLLSTSALARANGSRS